MSEFTERLHELIEADPSASVDDLTDALLASARSRKDLAELVRPAVADRVRDRRREFARRVERQAFGHGSCDARRPGAESADPAGARAAWLAEGFMVPDNGRVTWGAATVDDHLARIELLGKLRQGLTDTIDRHRWAVELIEHHRASCLSDVPVHALADLDAAT